MGGQWGWQGPRRGRQEGQEPVSQRGSLGPWGRGPDAQAGGLCGSPARRGACVVVSHALPCWVLAMGWGAAGSRGHCSLPSPRAALHVTCVTWRPSLGHFPRETPESVPVTLIYPIASHWVWLAHKHLTFPIREPRAPLLGRPSCWPVC